MRKSRSVHVKFRLVRRGPKPTRAETLAAIDYILDKSRVPEGWTLRGLDWEKPGARSSGGVWALDDIRNVRPLLYAMRQRMQVALVRKV